VGRYQRGQQRLGGTHACTVPQTLTQRGAVIPPAKAWCERLRMGIERGEAVEATPRRKNQRVQAVHKRRLAMRQQRTVIARRRVRRRLDRLGALGHNRAKGLVVVEPMGTQRHADTRQTGHNLDEMPLRRRFFFARALGAGARCLD
jgi:hypothetical protein